MSVGLRITRNEGESWRDCAKRYARKYGLEYEVGEHFDAEIEVGTDEAQAALNACWEWDICDLHGDSEARGETP